VIEEALHTDTSLDEHISLLPAPTKASYTTAYTLPPLPRISRPGWIAGFGGSPFGSSTQQGARRATFNVQWELLKYIREELEAGQALNSTLVLSGTTKNAYATSCTNYLHKFWPETGALLLSTLENVLNATYSWYYPATSLLSWPPGCEVDIVLERELDTAKVSVKGTSELLVQIGQQLVWLASVFSSPIPGRIAFVEGDILSIKSPESLTTATSSATFEIKPGRVLNLQETTLTCWHGLFVNTVIAHEFPIPSRSCEIGIELPFELMTALAHIRYPADVDKGIILKGFSTLLFPTSSISKQKNTVQWHYIQSPTDDRVPLSEAKKHSWNQSSDLESLKKARCMLGYYRRAVINLGTEDSGYDQISFSTAGKAKRRFSLAGLGVNIGIPKFGGPSVSANYTLNKTLMKGISSRDFDQVVRRAKNLSFVVYDTKTSRGWLVPAISVILHLCLAWAHQNPSLVDTPITPAERSRDGRQAALKAVKDNALKKLYDTASNPPKAYCFKDLVECLWEGVDKIFDVKAEQDESRYKQGVLQGWEFMQIVQEEPNIRPKEVKVDGLWPKLSWDPNVVVLFGQSIGEAIKADTGDPKANCCESWVQIPEHNNLLTASMECMKQLSLKCGVNDTGTYLKLTEGLYWNFPETSPFGACQHETRSICPLVQRFTDKPLSAEGQAPNEPRSPDDEGAIVFCDTPKKLQRKPTHPPIQLANDIPAVAIIAARDIGDNTQQNLTVHVQNLAPRPDRAMARN
jgi:hypothetical protein